MANGVERDGEDYKGRMGDRDEFAPVCTVLSLLPLSTHGNRVSSLPLLSLVATELEDLLIRGCAPVKTTGKKNDYDRSAYNAYARDVKAGFHKLYMFCYALAKPE